METVVIIAGLIAGGMFGSWMVKDDQKIGAELEVLAWALGGLILFVSLGSVFNLI